MNDAADRDDLAAILAKHRWEWEPIGPIYKCICGEEVYADIHRDDMEAHRAQMVLESDWLRDAKADVWDEARMTVLSGFVPESELEFLSLYPNPHRADNTTDRT